MVLKEPIDNELTQRGFRLSFTIKMTGLSRKEFAHRVKIPINTLRSWEQPQRNGAGLKEKAADRVVHALFSCGVITTKSWLLLGIGPAPILTESAKKAFLSVTEDSEKMDAFISEEGAIFQEIELFKKLHKNSVIAIVPDDSMEPFYSAFDYVGGVYRDDEFEKYIGRNCIIKIKDEDAPFIGRFHYSKKESSATIYTINISPNAAAHQYFNVKLLQIAEIVFHRKRELQSGA